MGSSKKAVIGYKYYLGMHMVLCHGPIDKVTAIYCDDDKLAWSGTCTGGDVTIYKPDLFGGEKREGGITGTVGFKFGEATQEQDSYLVDQLGANVPAYRRVVSVILKHVYVGMTPYLKKWKFRCQRIHVTTEGQTQWYDAKAAIGQDMNPAHIIYECLTSKTWGMGYEEGDIDQVSFMAAADQLYSEGLGLSLIWDSQKDLDEFISVIVQHISAALYVDITTGQFKLKLIRDDYDEKSLTLLDESNIIDVTDFVRPLTGELVNTVTVIFWDESTGVNSSVTVQDTALMAEQRVAISKTTRYPGITNGTNAAIVASRDLQALSTPLITCKVKTTRAAAGLSIGDPFIMSWPDYGIEKMVMRVTSIAYGGIDASQILIECVQDVFSFGEALIVAPPVTEWTSPVGEPKPVTIRKIYTAGYWDILTTMGPAEADAMDGSSGYFAITAVKPSTDSFYADIWTPGASGAYESRERLEFAPTALLTAAVGLTDTVINVGDKTDFEPDTAMVGKYLMINDECMRIDAIGSSTITVGRGVLDTIPAQHGVNDRVYFPGVDAGSDSILYGVGESVDARLTAVTMLGEYDVSSANNINVVISDRAALPYPPGLFKINGTHFGGTIGTADDLTVTWAHRDRTLQISETLADTLDSNIGPEAGVTYTVGIYTAGGGLIQEYTGISGTSQVVPVAVITAYSTIRVKLKAVRGGLDSWQEYDHIVNRV